jgi:hypothetical protein
VVVLCLIVGGIFGWALKGAISKPAGSVAMTDITPPALTDTGASRLAVYDGKELTVVNIGEDGTVSGMQTRRVK